MPPAMENIKNTVVTEVPAGSRVTLDCHSNDYNHNFLYWILGDNEVIGPGSRYDDRKYKYEVLSGKLHIDQVSPEETGYYRCVSGKVQGGGYTVGAVEMIVKGSTFSAMDAVKLVAIVVSIIVLISCAVIYYRLRKEWSKYDGRSIVPSKLHSKLILIFL
ncbi:immunoglobulin domain-containing protein [Phthorimaea operculella]|nr:immunoglobulin domain-containing protein [Phthorimaea operculella]